jgi:hypothetical protein
MQSEPSSASQMVETSQFVGPEDPPLHDRSLASPGFQDLFHLLVPNHEVTAAFVVSQAAGEAPTPSLVELVNLTLYEPGGLVGSDSVAVRDTLRDVLYGQTLVTQVAVRDRLLSEIMPAVRDRRMDEIMVHQMRISGGPTLFHAPATAQTCPQCGAAFAYPRMAAGPEGAGTRLCPECGAELAPTQDAVEVKLTLPWQDLLRLLEIDLGQPVDQQNTAASDPASRIDALPGGAT